MMYVIDENVILLITFSKCSTVDLSQTLYFQRNRWKRWWELMCMYNLSVWIKWILKIISNFNK